MVTANFYETEIRSKMQSCTNYNLKYCKDYKEIK